MRPIPLDTHPHILDSIVRNASYAALLALRTASRPVRDRVDAALTTHIALYAGERRIASVHEEGHVPLPRRDWLDVPALADAVRVVDLMVTEEDECNSRARRIEWEDSVRLLREGDVHSPRRRRRHTAALTYSSVPYPRCWCNQEIVTVSPFYLHLSERLRHIKLVRQWRGHRCRQVIAAERTITFVPEGTPLPIFMSDDEMPSDVHVVHVPYNEMPHFHRTMFPQTGVSNIVFRISPRPIPQPLITVDGSSEHILAVFEHMRPAPDPRAFDKLVKSLSRQSANGVTITLVGLDQWDLAPDVGTVFPQFVARAFRKSLRDENIPMETDIWDLSTATSSS